MNKINDWLAVKLTQIVGSMWCAYLFTIIALIGLPAAIASHNVYVLVSWIAQTFLQLVLLSVIMVGQEIQSRKAEERTEKMLTHITQENDRILKEITVILRDEQKILIKEDEIKKA